jgi:uncharacterized protein (UPF0218 family)
VPSVVARLPAAERGAFKEPLGEVYGAPEALLGAAGEPIVAVGDVVLAHLGEVGCVPAVSIIDGHTERSRIDAGVRESWPAADSVREVENPAATITGELVDAIEAGLAETGPTRIVVDGEEDLAVVPAVLLAPTGATVVYGQPGEGMVAVDVDAGTRSTVRAVLDRLDRDRPFWERVG